MDASDFLWEKINDQKIMNVILLEELKDIQGAGRRSADLV